MRNGEPKVLVVASFDSAERVALVRRNLGNQTFGGTQLLLLRRNSSPVKTESADARLDLPSSDICALSDFSHRVEASGCDYVLFFPAEGALKPAAVEKLVLALHLAPDQDGVADLERGSTGLWLARHSARMGSLIARWPQSQVDWITECLRSKPGLFHIAENLHEIADPAELRRPFAVEHLFAKLPSRFENLQPISTEPVWDVGNEGTNDRSVLFLVSNLRLGGACKFILDVAGQLKANGYRVTVVTANYETGDAHPWLEALLRITPDVFVLSHGRAAELPRTIVHLARTHGCRHVVLSHSMPGYHLLPWLRNQLSDVSFLDFTHIEHETEWPDGGYALRSIQYQNMLDLSVVSSEHLRDWMTERGADSSRIRVCHTNIDADRWTPSEEQRARVRKELGLDERTAMILYPCRIAPQKRPELLCNIAAALRRSTETRFVIVVAGDGVLRPALEGFVEKHGLTDCVKLLGTVSLDRVAQLHNASDIFLLPSLIEGIALALYEAMALGSVPVVADVGGQREVVTKECGFLIAPGPIENELHDYVLALKQLIEQPETRRLLSAACRARIREHFHIRQMISNFISALGEATARREQCQPTLPAADIAREMATLAMDRVRLNYEGKLMEEMRDLFQEQVSKQERMIAKLQRQIEAGRNPGPHHREAHELRH